MASRLPAPATEPNSNTESTRQSAPLAGAASESASVLEAQGLDTPARNGMPTRQPAPQAAPQKP
jgi:hypothetical protein